MHQWKACNWSIVVLPDSFIVFIYSITILHLHFSTLGFCLLLQEIMRKEISPNLGNIFADPNTVEVWQRLIIRRDEIFHA